MSSLFWICDSVIFEAAWDMAKHFVCLVFAFSFAQSFQDVSHELPLWFLVNKKKGAVDIVGGALLKGKPRQLIVSATSSFS